MIPEALRDFDHWLVVNMNKEPVNPLGDPTRVDRLLSYEEANRRRTGDRMLAFQFSETPFVGIDYDKIAVDREIGIPNFRKKVLDCFDTYSEWSQSGTGVHQIVRGELLDDYGHRTPVTKEGSDEEHPPIDGLDERPHIEIYDSDRYFVLTGDQIDGFPEQVEEAPEKVAELHRRFDERGSSCGGSAERSEPDLDPDVSAETVKRTLEEFAKVDHPLSDKARRTLRLWREKPAREAGDPSSEDDLTFANLMTFWAKGDDALVEACVSASDRWDEKWARIDYRARTLDKADHPDRFRGRYVRGSGQSGEPPGSGEASLRR